MTWVPTAKKHQMPQWLEASLLTCSATRNTYPSVDVLGQRIGPQKKWVKQAVHTSRTPRMTLELID